LIVFLCCPCFLAIVGTSFSSCTCLGNLSTSSKFNTTKLLHNQSTRTTAEKTTAMNSKCLRDVVGYGINFVAIVFVLWKNKTSLLSLGRLPAKFLVPFLGTPCFRCCRCAFSYPLPLVSVCLSFGALNLQFSSTSLICTVLFMPDPV